MTEEQKQIVSLIITQLANKRKTSVDSILNWADNLEEAKLELIKYIQEGTS